MQYTLREYSNITGINHNTLTQRARQRIRGKAIYNSGKFMYNMEDLLELSRPAKKAGRKQKQSETNNAT